MGAKSKGRIPRNKKKSWKKQVDIAEVEEYLDDVRLQERHGGLVSEKEDSEMFIIDSVPGSSPSQVTSSQLSTRRPKVDQDNLRCFQNLKGLPGAKVPKKRNSIKDKTPAFVKQKKQTKQHQAESKAIKIHSTSILKAATEKSKLTDPWASDDEADGDGNDWAAAGITNRQRVRRDAPTRRPLYMRVKTSLLPAVQLPHAGQSYHPTAEDHEQLLQKAAAVEHRIEADRQRWEKQTTAKFPASRPTQEDWLRDMSGGMHPEEPGAVAEEEAATTLPVRKIPKPKTRQQRRKLAERKAAERDRLVKKATKVMENDVFRVRALSRELRQRADRTQQRQERRLQRLQARAAEPLTLGKQRFQPASIELSLPDELPGTLRNLQAEGCPFEDRFKSLQRRNIIEPRTRTTQKKKYKRKKFPRVTQAERFA